MTPPPPLPEPPAGPLVEAELPRRPWLMARPRLLRALALLPALAFALMALSPPLNHDVAAVLNFAERWVGGERLYRDLLDVNPPLIFILTAIPAAIARWTPLNGVQALLGCVMLCCVLAWRMTQQLRDTAAEGVVERATLDALVPLIIVLAAYDVGQREHLMALFALPYAFLAMRRMQGLPTARSLALSVSIAAALGFALKPHFLAVPLLVEALVLSRRGLRPALRDPLPWVMALIWVVYLASIPLVFADYFGFVVPLVMDFYLASHGFGLLDVLLGDKMGAAGLALLAALALLAWRDAGDVARAIGCVGAGAFLSAWVQHKGWSYHIVPIAMMTALLVGLVVARWLDRALPPARALHASPMLAIGIVMAVSLVQVHGESPWRQIGYGATRDGELTRMLRREVAGERLLVLSPDIFPVYPALNYAEARSTLRTMNLWVLVGAYPDCVAGAARYRETWEMSRAEFMVYRTVAEDFARAPPGAVLVARNAGIPRCDGEEFDLIAYFSRHPAFAETWQRFTRVIHLDTYKLYVRED